MIRYKLDERIQYQQICKNFPTIKLIAKFITAILPQNNHYILSIFQMIDSSDQNSISNPQPTIKKLTMGFQNYRDIKQAHLKNRLCQQSLYYQQKNQYTFHPQLSNKKIKTSKRSFQKFLQDQQNFTAQKKKKIQQLRLEISKQEEEELSHKPCIDTVSHRISTQMSKNQNVFDRLSKQKPIVYEVFEQEEMFSPKICAKSKSLKRQKDVGSLLYEDALRRKEKEQINIKELLKRQPKPQINNNTNYLVIKKIYHQFTSMIKKTTVSPLEAITVLSQIFNVDLNPNKSTEQEILCEKVLLFVADMNTQTVNSEVLWNFIQTIVNGHLINSNYTFEQEQQIIENFAYFYTQRLTKNRKSLIPEKLPFRPKTLRSSQKLAKKHRQRTLSSINQYMDSQKLKNNTLKIEDLFMMEYMKKNSQIQRKRIQKENIQIQQCSFRPNLQLSTQTQKTAHKKVSLVVKTTKTQELQKKVKIKIKQNLEPKQNQQRFSTMYETSNPTQSKRLNTETNSNTLRTPKVKVKNIEKNVMRVALARKNRQLVNALNERGYPSNVENWQNFKKSLKKDVEKSSEKILRGYNSVEKLNCSLLKTSTMLISKQLQF